MTSSAELGISPRERWKSLTRKSDDASHPRPDEHKSSSAMTLKEARDEVDALRSTMKASIEEEQARMKDWRARLEAEISDLSYREKRANARAKREQAKAQRMHRRAQEAESKLAMVRRAIAETGETA